MKKQKQNKYKNQNKFKFKNKNKTNKSNRMDKISLSLQSIQEPTKQEVILYKLLDINLLNKKLFVIQVQAIMIMSLMIEYLFKKLKLYYNHKPSKYKNKKSYHSRPNPFNNLKK